MNQDNEIIKKTRDWVNNQIKEVKKFKYEKHRKIIALALIDAFAQHSVGYSRKNQECFSVFLITYGGKYTEILKSTCPVTLYYNYHQYFPEGFELTLNYTKLFYDITHPDLQRETIRLISNLNCKGKQKEKAIAKHRYANLLYALRNKLVHEFVEIGIVDPGYENPRISVEFGRNGDNITRKWILTIPDQFIIDIASTTINNFLDQCNAPFEYNTINRRFYYTWYDK